LILLFLASRKRCFSAPPEAQQSKPSMKTPLKAQRYLLREGKFIIASIRLDPAHVYRYVCQNGSVILALLSAQIERLLLRLIQQSDESAALIQEPTQTSKAPQLSMRRLTLSHC
jgi:hypothetical protein